MQPELTKQHEWLRKHFVGQWEFESVCPMPDGTQSRTSGRETVRLLGDAWIVGEGVGEMPGGGEGRWMTIVGYDPAKERFVGTWTGTMMTNMFVYSGFLDDAERVLTLETEGPHFTEPGKTATYRDMNEFRPGGERIMTSHMLGEDGKWVQFMEARFRRSG